ncbi:metal-dependent hydrolase [Leptolyngbya sp. NIES-2104]|uniref:metal-dependent hydrolase n=1 Tax=Leptolyngbya sp. NIES-2104 TaxID=1552121 RepID=UPI0006EC8960|nr:metal-dependent hydrolase [Leptolyngbya sp. NIES-2104]GAP97351.1 beta-lactamase domain protein [Leptolyngbya sp. NIES-2104]
MKLKRFFQVLIPAAIAIVVFLFSTTIPGTAAPTGKTQLYWYGQSAFRITTPTGKILLVDPWLTNPVNPNGKTDLANLNRVDLILITHGHFDHVGDAIAIAKKTNAPLVSTADLGRALTTVGYPQNLVPMNTQGNFGGEISLLNNEVRIAFIPAIHSSAVASDGSPAQFAGNPGGFLITVQNGPTIYHTGDTDVFADMSLIPQFRKVNVMLACIGDRFTMGPQRAATAVNYVKPDVVIPMHFGTFPALTGTPQAFQTELDRQKVKTKLQVMKVGQTVQL